MSFCCCGAVQRVQGSQRHFFARCLQRLPAHGAHGVGAVDGDAAAGARARDGGRLLVHLGIHMRLDACMHSYVARTLYNSIAKKFEDPKAVDAWSCTLECIKFPNERSKKNATRQPLKQRPLSIAGAPAALHPQHLWPLRVALGLCGDPAEPGGPAAWDGGLVPRRVGRARRGQGTLPARASARQCAREAGENLAAAKEAKNGRKEPGNSGKDVGAIHGRSFE
eukprot:6198387-Pleurochrysis_carterae.AAC.1